jgi:hypothetical protein
MWWFELPKGSIIYEDTSQEFLSITSMNNYGFTAYQSTSPYAYYTHCDNNISYLDQSTASFCLVIK